MKSFDVVIIGAGLAGLQCAKLLSRQGAKILLVDRKTDLTKGVHTTGIFVRKTFEDFDFPVGTLGKPIRNVTLYSPKLKAMSLRSERDEFRVGKMGLLYENYLKECLENGVEFSKGTRYVLATTGTLGSPLAMSAKHENSLEKSGSLLANVFRRGSDGCKLEACAPVGETIVKLEKDSKSFEVRTKILVGADGAVSRVAKDLGLDENKEWIVGYEEVFKGVPSDSEPRLHCFLDAKLAPGYLAWVADDGEEIHIGVGGYPSVFNPREALKLFKKKIIGNLLDLGGAELTETRGGRIPVGGVLNRIACTHGLLIGDAAGAVSPLTAGGLDPCLRLSAMASEVIAESLQKSKPEILLGYSGNLFRSRFVSRLWMRRIIANLTNQKLLELGFAFLRGKIGQRFAKHVFFGRGSFPDVEIKKGSEVLQPKIIK